MPGRAVVERLPDGAERYTGIWIGDRKTRRARLGRAQLVVLAEPGVDWVRP
ncbi:hypothetical protein AB0O22_23080 [Streptomyces sp. NPDC091204]|uniref:hypothetical protein n=1 Tax=Streptomyces sp. NPDC091204 TaxID=3155299 RepID=UPI00341F6351